jgi:hypothetical protein
LPFALAFVAIPLEYLITSGRTVIGALLVMLTRGLGLILRILSNLLRHAATALTMAYDVLIFLPLLIERLVRSRGAVGETATSGSKKIHGQDDFRKAG